MVNAIQSRAHSKLCIHKVKIKYVKSAEGQVQVRQIVKIPLQFGSFKIHFMKIQLIPCNFFFECIG